MRYADVQRLREEDPGREAAGHSAVDLDPLGEPKHVSARPCACGAGCILALERPPQPCGGGATVLKLGALAEFHLCAVHLITYVEAMDPERLLAEVARGRAEAVAEAEAVAIYRRPAPTPTSVLAAVEIGIQGAHSTADRSATLLHVACAALSYVAATVDLYANPGQGTAPVEDALTELAALFGVSGGVGMYEARGPDGEHAIQLAAKLRRTREVLAEELRVKRESGR